MLVGYLVLETLNRDILKNKCFFNGVVKKKKRKRKKFYLLIFCLSLSQKKKKKKILRCNKQTTTP